MKMKRILYIAMMTVLAASCSKDEIGGTSTESLAGEWTVTATAVDDEGNTVLTDSQVEQTLGYARFKLNTYNTAANDGKQIWVDDMGNFKTFKVRTDCDPAAQTFSTAGAVENILGEASVTITDGRVIYGVARNPHGTAADSIVFYATFSGDADALQHGFAKYRISGYRYTGFYEDD